MRRSLLASLLVAGCSTLKVIASHLQSPRGIAVRLDKVYVALGDGRIVALPH